jgi:hypothetical protein
MSESLETTAPPTGEQIHMPQPSIIPLVNAAALAGAIVCVTFKWWLSVAFLILFLATTVRWIKDTVRDINELPLDHSAH